MINKALTKLWLYYTIIVGDFNTPLTLMDRSTKQKINKETQTLNDTIDQLDLIDIYRTFHRKNVISLNCFIFLITNESIQFPHA